jgi:hypothetical protein
MDSPVLELPQKNPEVEWIYWAQSQGMERYLFLTKRLSIHLTEIEIKIFDYKASDFDEEKHSLFFSVGFET